MNGLYWLDNVATVEHPSDAQKLLAKNSASVRVMTDFCSHCENSCLVIFDDSPGLLEPCPCCRGGFLRSAEYASGTQGFGRGYNFFVNRNGAVVYKPDWFEGVDVSVLSWNRGLTLEYRFSCVNPWCNNPCLDRHGPCVACRRKRENSGAMVRMPSMNEMLAMFNKADAKAQDEFERGLLIRDTLSTWKRRSDSKHEKGSAA